MRTALACAVMMVLAFDSMAQGAPTACVGSADNFVGAGHCAAWDSQGRLLASLDEHVQGLVLLDTAQERAQTVRLDGLAR